MSTGHFGSTKQNDIRYIQLALSQQMGNPLLKRFKIRHGNTCLGHVWEFNYLLTANSVYFQHALFSYKNRFCIALPWGDIFINILNL